MKALFAKFGGGSIKDRTLGAAPPIGARLAALA